MPGPLDFYEPPPAPRLPPTPKAGPGFIGSIVPGFQRARAGEDYGLNQLRYEDGPLKEILAEASKRGFRAPRGSAPVANNAYGQAAADGRSISEILDAGTDQLLAWAAAERRRDPKFLPQYVSINSRADLRRWALDRRRADVGRADRALEGGSTLGQLAGGLGAGFLDPTSYIPVGGQVARVGSVARQVLTVAGREAAANAAVTVALEPLVQADAAALGVKRGVGTVLTEVALAGATGGLIGGGAKAAEIGVKKVAGRVAARSAQTGTAPDRAIVEQLREAVGADRMTPDEKAAANVVERDAEVREASPYETTPAGDDAHEAGLAAALRKIIDDAPPVEAARVASPEPRVYAAPLTPEVRPARAGAPRDAAGGAETFIAKIRRAESGGDDAARNPRSSATGRYQFVDDTWVGFYTKTFGAQGMSRADILAKRGNGDVQDAVMRTFTEHNGRQLDRLGQPRTAGNHYLMHWAGEAGGAALLRADPGRPAIEVLGGDVAAANPGLVAGKSVSEVIAWAHRKMGGSAASVPASRTASGAAVDDPEIALLRDEALALQQASIAIDGEIGVTSASFRADEIGVDAGLMQFKAGGDEFGVTERLAGVTRWEPLFANPVLVWEAADGRRLVADGHQRLGLAKRLSADGQDIRLDAKVLRESDGITAQEARVWAALKNMSEGSGTSIDAAKVIRDVGDEAFAEWTARLPQSAPVIRDARALARLSPEAFGAVYNEVIPADHGAAIGRLLPDAPDAHLQMVELLRESDPANRTQAESLVRQAIAAGFVREEQTDMFGTRAFDTSLFLPKAKLLDAALARLRKLKLVYGTAAREADTLEAAGSTIARSQSEREAGANGQAIEFIERLAYRAGPIGDALTAAARKLAAGGKRADVAAELVATIRAMDLDALAARGGDAGDAGGAGTGGERGDGDAFEALDDPPPFADDPGQPRLDAPPSAAAVQLLREFDDPRGVAANSQADMIAHDIRAAIDAGDLDGQSFAALGVATEDDIVPIYKSAHEILSDLDADDAAIKALGACL